MKIIGHRGARGLAAENTLVSFHKAIEHGVDEIEFDVRVSKDGVAIVHHDAELHDPAGNHLVIGATKYADLLAHKPDLPTFEAAMRGINKAVPVLIEVKPGIPAEPVIAVIHKLRADGWQDSDMSLGSFSQPLLRELHTALPTIPKVVNESWSGVRATYRARQLNTKRVNMNRFWLWPGFIKAMQKSGYQLAPYTLNDPKQAARWAKHGICAVITDYPDRFQKK